MNIDLIKGVLRDTIDLTHCNCPENKCDGSCTYSQAVRSLEELNKPVRFAVFLDGGLVQEVYSDRPAELIKIDLDVDEASPEDLFEYPDRSGNVTKAYVDISKSDNDSILEVDAEYIDQLFKSQE